MKTNILKLYHPVTFITIGVLISALSLIDFGGQVSWSQTDISGSLIVLLIITGIWVPVILKNAFKLLPFLDTDYYLIAISIIALVIQIISYQISPVSRHFYNLLWALLYGTVFMLIGFSKNKNIR